MKLSTRTRYGLRAILELAENYGKGPVQLKAIASHQNISAKYLEQLMIIVKSAGIVRSVMETARQLAAKEGILAGISSGAAMWAAIQISQRSQNEDKTIVVILSDTGERYISTELFG